MMKQSHSNVIISDKRQKELNPSAYADVFAFREAIANGTIDIAKACHNMDEYRWSLEHGGV